MFGKLIEKNIRHREDTNDYMVIFSFGDKANMVGLPTLEDARKYRDAINAEKLAFKIKRDVAIIREKEKEEINIELPYPFNIIESLKISEQDFTNEDIDNFDSIISDICTEREMETIKLFYAQRYTLNQIGKVYGITKERVRQIIAKGIRKVNYHLLRKNRTTIEQKEYEHRCKIREQMLKTLKETGNYSNDMALEFGELIVHKTKDIKIKDMGLTTRSYYCLKRVGITTLEELAEKTDEDLMKIRNLGKKSFREIKAKLKELGYETQEPF